MALIKFKLEPAKKKSPLGAIIGGLLGTFLCFAFLVMLLKSLIFGG